MGGNLRKSGIKVIGDVPWGTRICQFHKTQEESMDLLIPYFKAGLENNEFCFWSISQSSEVEEAKKALRVSVPEIDAYLDKGQMEIASCSQGYVSGDAFNSEIFAYGWIVKLNKALENGFSGLRIAGDISWLKEGNPDNFANYVKKVNSILENYNIMVLCLYSLDTCSAADIIEVACSHQFVLIKKKGKWERIENSGKKYLPAQMPVEDTPVRNGQSISLKSENTYSSDKENTSLDLADIIDIPAIQSLINDFYEFAHITIGILDLKGNILVSIGWQDICTRFHRVHPEACKHCVESDTKLSSGVSLGEFKLYRCRNNMWDAATPIMVGGKHVGNIFSGQFFFEDELLDYELFRAQARKYGFNEEEYIEALEKVPRLSSEVVATAMAFFAKLANMISQLSYSNIKLSQSLAERDALVAALRESDERFRSVLENSLDSAYRFDLQNSCFDYMSPVIERITGFPAKEISAMSFNAYLDHIHPDDRPLVIAGTVRSLEEGLGAHEYRFKCKDGKYRWLADHFSIIKDNTGLPHFRAGIIRDITESKRAEEALRFSNLYNRSLIEASLDPSATIGRDGKIRDVNDATEQVIGYPRNYLVGTDFSDYFTEPEKAHAGYQQVFRDGKVRDYPLEIQHKDGHITPVLYNASVYRDENGEAIGVFAVARDITERKTAEEALKKAYDNLEEIIEERTAQLEMAYNSLKESEKGLAEAQKMGRIGNWEWDIAADKAYWSEEMYRIFGRNPRKEAPSYNEYLNYIHPDDRANYCNAIKKTVKGKPLGIDFRIVLDNGKERVVHQKSELVMDNQNIPVRVKGIVQDITEHKKSEEKIQILANIVKSSNDAIGTVSLDDIITSCNEEAEKVYGYSAEEVIGKPTSILAPPHLRDETKRFSELIKQGKKIHHYETSRLRKDGKLIHVSITLSPVFDSHGKLTAISFISRDISERKRVEEKLRESEEKYRNIVETANEGIFIIDAETTVTYANKKLADMLGYTLEEVIGRTIWNFVSEEGKIIIELNHERRPQGINESYELKLICKSGSSLWVLVNSKSLFDTDGWFMGSISMLTDITKRKEAEEALVNVEIIRKKEIHHRIKNNLQVISSLLDLQAEKFRDKEVLEAFRESQNRVLSMSLIHEELYKGEGTDTLNFSAYLQKLANNLFQTYSLRSKNLHLLMDLEENAFFNMDTSIPLGIIVNELVSNSLKHAFIEGEEGEIRIRLFREEINDKTHQSFFSLTISDNGKGIPESLELGNVESLGLQLVSILVDQLDGSLELKREHGTEFRISFRVVESSKLL